MGDVVNGPPRKRVRYAINEGPEYVLTDLVRVSKY